MAERPQRAGSVGLQAQRDREVHGGRPLGGHGGEDDSEARKRQQRKSEGDPAAAEGLARRNGRGADALRCRHLGRFEDAERIGRLGCGVGDLCHGWQPSRGVCVAASRGRGSCLQGPHT